jgi:hypothetical protein
LPQPPNQSDDKPDDGGNRQPRERHPDEARLFCGGRREAHAIKNAKLKMQNKDGQIRSRELRSFLILNFAFLIAQLL